MKEDYEIRLDKAEEEINKILEHYNVGLVGNYDYSVLLYCNDNHDKDTVL